jgi:hypothetical protein
MITLGQMAIQDPCNKKGEGRLKLAPEERHELHRHVLRLPFAEPRAPLRLLV